MKKLKTILILLVGLALLAGCGKDDPKPNNPANLTSGNGKWILTARTNVVGGNSEDVYANYAACVKDNEYSFASNGVYQQLSGPTICSGETNVLETGTWTMSQNGKQLTIQLTGAMPKVFDILLLNATTLKVKYEVVDSGVTNTTTSTYTKQ